MRTILGVALVATAAVLLMLAVQQIAGTKPSDRARDAGLVKAGP